MTAETLRPNGKTYRPRKGPVVEEFMESDGLTCVVVLRTHDVEAARALAAGHIDALYLDATDARTDWWRLVPWDSSGDFDRSFITDAARGVPCVIFGGSW